MAIIDGETRLFGLIGHPVRRSMSPVLHNAAFAFLGINACYMAFDVQDLDRVLQGIRALAIQGVSVTSPFKERILPLLDGMDGMARRIGAVNTILWKGEELHGANTDWIGAVSALEERTGIEGKVFLVIGAGGAARAIAVGLSRKGAKVFLTNRTEERGRKVAEELEVEWVPWMEREAVRPDGMINATSLGMVPPDSPSEATRQVFPMDPGVFSPGRIVMDIVTHPLDTPWLQEARRRGAITIDGSSMLLYQAAAQFELWFERAAPVEAMKRALKDHRERMGTDRVLASKGPA